MVQAAGVVSILGQCRQSVRKHASVCKSRRTRRERANDAELSSHLRPVTYMRTHTVRNISPSRRGVH